MIYSKQVAYKLFCEKIVPKNLAKSNENTVMESFFSKGTSQGLYCGSFPLFHLRYGKGVIDVTLVS